MAWKDDIVTDFVVSTGDNKVFTPISSYLSWNYHYEFNIAEFVFNNVEGELVKRGKKRGTQYNIELIFQGADNVRDALEFDKSARNSNPWTLTHPFYGSLYVQPVWLTFNNAELNTTKVTGLVIETLKDNGVAVPNNVPNSTPAAVAQINQRYAETQAANMPVPDVSYLSKLQANVNSIYSAVLGRMTQAQDFMDQYTGYYNRVNNLINNTVFDTLELAGAAQNLITYPAYFAIGVANRLTMFETTLDILAQDVDIILSAYGLGTPERPLLYRKQQYELNAGAAIAGVCLALVTEIADDYSNRPAILAIVARVIVAYNGYVTNLCRLQSANAAIDTNYIPDAESVSGLQNLVMTVTAYLYNLTGTAKQQRTYTAPYDTNILVVADEVYGLDADDVNVLALIANNNLGQDELLILPKGRQLLYYV